MGRFWKKLLRKNARGIARTRIVVQGDEDLRSGVSDIFHWLENGEQKAMENSRLMEDDDESEWTRKWRNNEMSYRGFNVYHHRPGYGRTLFRPIIKEYYLAAAALVLVVDSEDSNELKWTKINLDNLRQDPNLDGAVIVVAAKMSNAISAEVVEDAINKGEQKNIKVFPTDDETGEGVKECFDWLVDEIEKLDAPAQNADAVTEPWKETVKDVTKDGKAGFKLLKAAGKSLMSKLVNAR